MSIENTIAVPNASALEILNHECDYNRITGQNQDSIKFNFNAGYWMHVFIFPEIILRAICFFDFYSTFCIANLLINDQVFLYALKIFM